VRALLAVAISFAVLLGPRTTVVCASPGSASAFYVAQGREREAQGNSLAALQLYAKAVEVDPSSEEAWLAFAAVREKRGELSHAEEIYDLALERCPLSLDLLVGRGRVRRLRARYEDAENDLQRAWSATTFDGSSREIGVLREKIALERDAKRPAAELACFRRLLAIARASGDAALEKEASIQARALGLFVGDVDPVLLGKGLDDPLRHSLGSIARRGG
jgi:tetratricopeptide (TPR) repeat protein